MSAHHWTFHWQDTAQVLAEQDALHNLTLDVRRRSFVGAHVRVTPPLVLPIRPEIADLAAYLDKLPSAPQLHFTILLQAGAAALGVFDQGAALATKSDKKYVVRGRGRAQPTHLAGKGKSRYGSRLRLQNARRLLDDVAARLREWASEYGAPNEIFYSASDRIWTSLLAHDNPPPFTRADPLIKIPHDIPVPTTDVLLRTYRKLSYGRVEATDPEG